jgi:hypothetical protein
MGSKILDFPVVQFLIFIQRSTFFLLVVVAHTCNPSYLRGREWED